ncbi:hypothetical protein DTL42_04340 [Bremerella cremea]|uniref:ParD-like antitoxin of type II toxin-antitoxin system n=1 Tax=Bremerella cremea TaxID=1031537 RepID=A0A368KYK8_9BACT|nr:hypothetical protein [Bremerella cremea]RCS54382.1 hypothetical protein DTL42_04340 [Bremerella cremea]
MSEPIQLSDALVNEARATGAMAERSLASQIELWAQLGKVIEPLLYGDPSLPRKEQEDVQSLAHALSSVDSPQGQASLQAYLAKLSFPHYEPTNNPDLLIRIEEDGSRTTGGFVNGKFVAFEQRLEEQE